MNTPSLLLSLLVLAPVQDTPREPRAPGEGSGPVPRPQAPPVPGPLALVGGIVHAMDGATPGVATVVLRDRRVEAVHRGAAPELADDVQRIDVTGMHILPGLIDGAVNHDVEHDALYLAHGVTLVRDTGNTGRILSERRPAARDRIPGPDLFVAGPVLDGPRSATTEAFILPDDRQVAVQYLERLLERLSLPALENDLPAATYHPDYLSFHFGLTESGWLGVLDWAHGEADLEVWGPQPHGVPLEAALEAGQDGLFGLDALLPPGKSWRGVAMEELAPRVEAVAGAGIAVTPMLLSYVLPLTAPDLEHSLRALSPYYAESWRAEGAGWKALRAANRPALEEAAARARGTLLALWEAGVPLVPGSGSPHPGRAPGFGLVEELEAWVQAGIAPGDVLRAATADAARHLGLEGRGAVVPGGVADLVVVGADPRSTLASLRDPELVVVRGRLVERDELTRLVDDTIAFQDDARALLAAPIEVALPDLPELADAHLLLEGRAEALAYGQRISSERFGVYRMPDGRRGYATRLVLPPTLRTAEVHVQLVQIFQGDRLDEFHLVAAPADENPEMPGWDVKGALIANSGRMAIQRRQVGRGILDTETAPDPITLVDLSDALTAMILGRHGKEGVLFALDIVGASFEPIADRWQVALDPTRHVFSVRTALGEQGQFGLDENGVPRQMVRQTGNSYAELRVEEVRLHGEGPGVLPASRIWKVPGEGAGEDGRDTEQDQGQLLEAAGGGASDGER